MAKIDKLLEALVSQSGSDLHLKQGQKPLMRLHGKLTAIDAQPELTEDSLKSMLQEIAEDNLWKKFDQTGDCDFAYSLNDGSRFRANYFRQFNGYGGIFRFIPSNIKTLEELDMPDYLKLFGQLPSGLVLVTGPTGSGKSTTLAAIINDVNEHQKLKIVTIEEPVEFMHPKKKSVIVQREVGLDTDTFANGLRSALKSDANIILVGEMRDEETIELALTAAEMGILVFGTLHTNSAAKTIDRIIDVFPASKKNQIRSILANSLKGIVAQQLCLSADGQRRWVAYEVLTETSALGAIIRSGDTNQLISEIQLNRDAGMILMDDCLMEMLKAGKISREQALMKAQDKVKFL